MDELTETLVSLGKILAVVVTVAAVIGLWALIDWLMGRN